MLRSQTHRILLLQIILIVVLAVLLAYVAADEKGVGEPDETNGPLGTVPLGAGGNSLKVVSPLTLEDGEKKTMARKGPLKIVATCDLDNAGKDIAAVVVETTENKTMLDGWDEFEKIGNDTHVFKRDFGAYVRVGANKTEIEANIKDSVVVSPSGRMIVGVSLYSSVNPPGHPNRCGFGGAFVLG